MQKCASVVFPKHVSPKSTAVTFVNPLFVNCHNNSNNMNEYIGMYKRNP